MKVVKKDGREENFDHNKIKIGIEKAAERVGVEKERARLIAEKLAKDVENHLRSTATESNLTSVKSSDIRHRVIEALEKEEKTIADSLREYKKEQTHKQSQEQIHHTETRADPQTETKC
ncbi:MAG: ATP cone domain-containing protein [Candidatus Aenigmatarchaeota archaeon]